MKWKCIMCGRMVHVTNLRNLCKECNNIRKREISESNEETKK